MSQTAKEVEIVIFSVEGEEFALPVGHVQEIVRPGAITRFSDEKGGVEGVTTLRGDVLPVVDLGSHLGLPSNRAKERMLVACVEGRLVGLLVDVALEVRRFPMECFREPPAALTASELGSKLGAIARVPDSDRVLLMPDISKLVLPDLNVAAPPASEENGAPGKAA